MIRTEGTKHYVWQFYYRYLFFLIYHYFDKYIILKIIAITSESQLQLLAEIHSDPKRNNFKL